MAEKRVHDRPVNPYFFECPVCGSISGIDCRTVDSDGPTSEARSFHQERIELAEEYNAEDDDGN